MTTFQLSYSREWLARRGLWLGVVGLFLPLALPHVGAAWALFLMGLVGPLLALNLGGTGIHRADRYWATLGGGPRSLLYGRLLLHLGFLSAFYGIAAIAFFNPEDTVGELWAWGQIMVPAIWGLSLLIYLSASVVRHFVEGFAVIAGPLLFSFLLAGGALLDRQIGYWSIVEGAALRACLLGGAALMGLAQIEGRFSASRLAGRYLWVVVGLTLFPTAIPFFWNGRTLYEKPFLVDVNPTTAEAFYTYNHVFFTPKEYGLDTILGAHPHQMLLFSKGDWSSVGPNGADMALFGPLGSRFYAISTPHPYFYSAKTFQFEASDGTIARCESPSVVLPYWVGFSPEGSAMAMTFESETVRLGVMILQKDGHCSWLSDQEARAGGQVITESVNFSGNMIDVVTGYEFLTLSDGQKISFIDWKNTYPDRNQEGLLSDDGHYTFFPDRIQQDNTILYPTLLK